jgi:hypothetical protein
MKSLTLLLTFAAIVAAQSSLNLSRDLTTLKIASQNMTPNTPTLDSQLLLTAAIAYAQSKSFRSTTAAKRQCT